MKKTAIGLFVLFGILLVPSAIHAADSCKTESDYLKRQQELISLSPCVKPGQECVRKLTPILTKELEMCRTQIGAYADRMCAKDAPKGATSVVKSDGTCKITCQKGSYLTKGGECKVNATSSKNQKRIDTLLKEIERLTKKLDALRGSK